jgi:hypothetical protein
MKTKPTPPKRKTRKEINRTAAAKMNAELDELARSENWPHWSAFRTAVRNHIVRIPTNPEGATK